MTQARPAVPRSAALAAALAAVVVCGGVLALGLHEKEWVPPVQLIGHDPRILAITTADGAYAGVGLGGTVKYLPNEGCFVLDDTMVMPPSAPPPEVDQATPVPTISGGLHGITWPYGSRPITQGDRRGVNVPGVGTVWDGDRIEGGGEGGPGDRVAKTFPSLPTSCLGISTYVLIDIDRVTPATNSDPRAASTASATPSTAATTQPGLGPCAPDNVDVEAIGPDPDGGATGEISLVLRITNHGTTACTLRSSPIVKFLDDNGDSVGLRRDKSGNGSMYLRGTYSASFQLQSGSSTDIVIAKYRCDLGSKTVATKVQLDLPGAGSTMIVPISEDVRAMSSCLGGDDDPGQTFAVSGYRSSK